MYPVHNPAYQTEFKHRSAFFIKRQVDMHNAQILLNRGAWVEIIVSKWTQKIRSYLEKFFTVVYYITNKKPEIYFERPLFSSYDNEEYQFYGKKDAKRYSLVAAIYDKDIFTGAYEMLNDKGQIVRGIFSDDLGWTRK